LLNTPRRSVLCALEFIQRYWKHHIAFGSLFVRLGTPPELDIDAHIKSEDCKQRAEMHDFSSIHLHLLQLQFSERETMPNCECVWGKKVEKKTVGDQTGFAR